MFKKTMIAEELRDSKYLYMIKYLLFSKNVNKNLKIVEPELLDIKFLITLNEILSECLERNILPNKCYQNLEQILIYLKEIYDDNYDKIAYENFMDLYYKIMGKFTEVKTQDSDIIYEIEFNTKFGEINQIVCPKEYNKNQLENSILYDFSVLFNIKGDENVFIEQLLPSYILNNLFIGFIKGLLIDFPALFLDDQIKDRILSVLKLNGHCFDDFEREKLLKDFKIINKLDNDDSVSPLLDKFIKENIELKQKVENINTKNYDHNFDVNSFAEFYYNCLLEKNIIELDCNQIDTNNLGVLERIYSIVVDNNKEPIYNASMKSNIIRMMSLYRDKYGHDKDFVLRYNKYLRMLNKTEDSDDLLEIIADEKLEKKEIKAILNQISKYGEDGEIDELINSLILDYDVLISLICNEEEYEKYKQKFVYEYGYINSIRKMFLKNQEMFDNKHIYSRVTEMIKMILSDYESEQMKSSAYYRKNTKMLKLINNYHSKDKMS